MRQNAIVALLSVIATLLLVNVLKPTSPMSGQTAGGTSTVGHEVAVATGSIVGGTGSNFWLYDTQSKRIAVYFLSNAGLEIRAVRDVSFDLEATDFNPPLGKPVRVNEMKKALKKAAKAAEKSEKDE